MERINENHIIEMAKDFKDRFEVKTNEIKELKKMIFTIYGLIRSGLNRDDTAFFEEIRCLISEFFDEEIFDD